MSSPHKNALTFPTFLYTSGYEYECAAILSQWDENIVIFLQKLLLETACLESQFALIGAQLRADEEQAREREKMKS